MVPVEAYSCLLDKNPCQKGVNVYESKQWVTNIVSLLKNGCRTLTSMYALYAHLFLLSVITNALTQTVAPNYPQEGVAVWKDSQDVLIVNPV